MLRALFLLAAASVAAADAEVSGQFLDSEGRDGGEIDFTIEKLKAPEDLHGTPIKVKSDRSGRWTATLAPGPYRLGDVRKPKKEDKRFFEGVLTQDLIEVGNDKFYDIGIIKLEKTGSFVTGTVKRGGKPAGGVTVEVFQAGAGIPTGQTATTTDAGEFELLFPETKAAQTVTVRVEEKGGMTFGSTPIGLWKSGAIDLALPDAYSDVIVDLTGTGGGEVRLYLHPSKEAAPYFLHTVSKDAKVEIPGLSPGAWSITAVGKNGGLANVDLTVPAKNPVAVAIPAGTASLSGRVDIAGLDPDADFRKFAVVARPGGAGPAGYLWSRIGRDGSFSFPALAPGKYELSIASGTAFEPMKFFLVRRSAVLQTVELPATKTVSLSAKAADFAE